MRKWLDRPLTDGPAYGYFLEASKTVLVVRLIFFRFEES